MRLAKALLLPVVLLIVSTACTPAAPQASTTPTPSRTWDAASWKSPVRAKTEAVSDAEAARRRARFLETTAQELGIHPQKTPALVRSIFPEEQGKVWSKCLADAGWPNASPGVEGGIKYKNPPKAQEAAFKTAYYDCAAAYTFDPRMLGGAPTEPMIEVQWYYLRDYAIPCLKAHGITPEGELPTKDTFVSSQGAYTPFRFGPPPTPDAIREACPQSAPSSQLLGLG